jgi:hypothetical protein
MDDQRKRSIHNPTAGVGTPLKETCCSSSKLNLQGARQQLAGIKKQEATKPLKYRGHFLSWHN